MLQLRSLVAAVALLAAASLPCAARAAFPGTSGKIAFVSSRDGNFEIYAMNPDGSGQTRLTNNPATDFDPAWSPDGRRILFTRGSAGGAEIFAMNADGSDQTRLTTNSADESHPAWSPDGQRIAFASMRDGNLEIYVMNADGSGQTRLTTHGVSDEFPAWSPDGRSIALGSLSSADKIHADRVDVLVMAADGSGQTAITAGGPTPSVQPDWQPAPGGCPDVKVGQAVAKGCFTETAAGSGVFTTGQQCSSSTRAPGAGASRASTGRRCRASRWPVGCPSPA